MEFFKASELAFDPRQQMGEIFADGFYEHGLKYLSKDKNKLARATGHIFNLESFYVAVTGNEIMAFIGCTNKKPSAVALNREILIRELGFFRGRIAYRVLNKYIVNNKYPVEQTLQTGFVEFVATAPEHRGKGAASKLLLHVIEAMPFSEYVLEVVDINDTAIRVYERCGFSEIKRVPAPKGSGFNYLVYMKHATLKRKG